MRVFVENGLAGCELALEHRAISVVVDALRASANVTSMFHYGTEEMLVVKEVEEAFAEKNQWPEAVLVGERKGPKVPGFDLGNSPLQEPPRLPIQRVIFSSSNCSRCLVGVADTPAAFLGSTVNAAATAQRVLAACQASNSDTVVLVTAGWVHNESLLTIEDHLAAGAITAAMATMGADLELCNDRADVCRILYDDGDQQMLTRRFVNCSNGRGLTRLGLGADVQFASRLDIFDVVPSIIGSRSLSSGGLGVLLGLR